MNLLITWCRTWRRSEPRWAAGRREGRVHRSCKAAAPRTESQTLSPRGSEDGENKGMRPDCSTRRLNSNDTHTHTVNKCVCVKSHQVERESLCALAAQSHLQQLLGQSAQHQQSHQGHGDEEAQHSHEAALAARPPVRWARLPVRTQSGSESLKEGAQDDASGANGYIT